jgi:hypothetical protein
MQQIGIDFAGGESETVFYTVDWRDRIILEACHL